MGVFVNDVMNEEIILYKRLLCVCDRPCGPSVLFVIIKSIIVLILMKIIGR
jgi:hypothetical protein